MSATVRIDYRDGVSESIRELGRTLQPAQLLPVAGEAARIAFFDHLRRLNQERPNALGGKRTQFYGRAAQATSFRVVSDSEVVVSIASVGIRQRYFGGTIKPKQGKYLTIPAIAEAHGKRASEFKDLHFAFEPDPRSGKPRPALVQGAASILGFRRGRDGLRRARAIGERSRRVVFWLVKSVTQQPDPTVLPEPRQVGRAVGRVVLDMAHRAWMRRTEAPKL